MPKPEASAPKSLFEMLATTRSTYRVLEPIKHGEMVNGVAETRDYMPGEEIELSSEHVPQLLQVGAIALLK